MEGNSEVDFKDIGCEGLDWIQLAQDMVQWRSVANTVP
jgi:hypothetical protein